jgi:hypothetical protein
MNRVRSGPDLGSESKVLEGLGGIKGPYRGEERGPEEGKIAGGFGLGLGFAGRFRED